MLTTSPYCATCCHEAFLNGGYTTAILRNLTVNASETTEEVLDDACTGSGAARDSERSQSPFRAPVTVMAMIGGMGLGHGGAR